MNLRAATDMATDALILSGGGAAESRLADILTFFGATCELLNVAEMATLQATATSDAPYAVFAPLDVFADALANPDAAFSIGRAVAIYLYATSDRVASEHALRRITGWPTAVLVAPSPGRRSMLVSNNVAELSGPMAGLAVTATPNPDDFVLSSPPDGDVAGSVTLLSVEGAPAFVRFERSGIPTYLCTSAVMPDIEHPVVGDYFDIKDYFCSLVPLSVFVTSQLASRIWRPLETGACLIIDDPLLKSRYGFVDFDRLLELMNEHDFTTNVAFIPWNWRRTTRSAATFFRREHRRFSVSIHGCDHTAREFGETRLDVIHSQVSLAQARMRRHETRTGIAHDAVMVFPQGVYSSQCLDVLKRHAFVAAVNTDHSPSDQAAGRARIRDVWDVAIIRHSTFPVFTRRYDFHGVENFAFDALLGKPCLIVTHHGFFKDNYTALLELLAKLNGLECSLTWRSLGDVIRRAGRWRSRDMRTREIEIYGSEWRWTNTTSHAIDVIVRKKESDPSLIRGVSGINGELSWSITGCDLVVTATVEPGCDVGVSITYPDPAARPSVRRPIRVKASVATRRLLCEFRDEYWQKLVNT